MCLHVLRVRADRKVIPSSRTCVRKKEKKEKMQGATKIYGVCVWVRMSVCVSVCVCVCLCVSVCVCVREREMGRSSFSALRARGHAERSRGTVEFETQSVSRAFSFKSF